MKHMLTIAAALLVCGLSSTRAIACDGCNSCSDPCGKKSFFSSLFPKKSCGCEKHSWFSKKSHGCGCETAIAPACETCAAPVVAAPACNTCAAPVASCDTCSYKHVKKSHGCGCGSKWSFSGLFAKKSHGCGCESAPACDSCGSGSYGATSYGSSAASYAPSNGVIMSSPSMNYAPMAAPAPMGGPAPMMMKPIPAPMPGAGS